MLEGRGEKQPAVEDTKKECTRSCRSSSRRIANSQLSKGACHVFFGELVGRPVVEAAFKNACILCVADDRFFAAASFRLGAQSCLPLRARKPAHVQRTEMNFKLCSVAAAVSSNSNASVLVPDDEASHAMS